MSIEKTLTIKLTAEDLGIPLAACPYCGSEAVDLVNTWTASYHVACFSCGAQGPPSTRPDPYRVLDHEAAAREAAWWWNQRPFWAE